MAKKSLRVKSEKLKKAYLKSLTSGKKPKNSTRVYNRCRLCGRNRGYMGKFDMCRICFRFLAREGKIMGVKKSSW
ncbi:type Z 30S ribosomal protein S14 [Candidatus Peregrinibacteria bacterium]|nr:type Z 30S ribosomal protein S14 [Candidatus Peregrinibacteria bacterium]